MLILLVFERLATISDTNRKNTVRHYNSVFHDLLKRVAWSRFDRLVDEHGADKHVRRLSTKSQFIALLYGQLSGAVSLREIVGGLESHAARLYHVGGKAGVALDAVRCQCTALKRGLCRSVSRDGRPRGPRVAPVGVGGHLSHRRDRRSAERSRVRLGTVFPSGLRRQGSCRLRRRCRATDLCGGHARQCQRHHSRQGHADRGGCDLCVRSWLL
ncbi:hypothetical protein AGR6A_Lc90500 [Agrobacterium sp. NCPPB 925]|nr:hypothetical protein AGR6A_Lc50106 [Agrobacterium sp. NCPPB 925]CUX67107.1 hypothetical protein AGR6A_Lc80037 [Agrobacterium sp. NCPPB 925]CUX67238.1 hypothetical protein AGR6A_Lc80061 [Agrobacterium sp. NCPPB 925]CUX69043.1 hypothetical protein AGR6A_Lc90331 [Agrobacterium sp. NCPPB 925]CUX69559.1 hypothetical protein AGR6A_Lc90500 [Agrobacterium sp. NCPPB 925]